MCRKNFFQNGLKNILFVLLISFSDVAVFFFIGLFLGGLDNIPFASAMIVCLFVVVCVLFLSHRLFFTQVGSVYDRSAMDWYRSAKSNEANRLYWGIITGRKNAVLDNLFASINILISIVCLFFVNFFAAIFALCTVAVYVYVAGRNIGRTDSECEKYLALLNQNNLDDNSSVEFNNADKILYQCGKFFEVSSETKSLLKIICIIGWAVSCLLPIIGKQTLSDFILAGVMLLYIISQSFVISQTYDDIIMVRYCINQIQQH